MPLWLKKLTWNLLKEHYKKIEESQSNVITPETAHKPYIPDVVQKAIKPTYTTQMPKK